MVGARRTYRQQGCFPLGEWEKCLMCVSGRLSVGVIRRTGKYDNISFRIKTPYFLYFKMPISFAFIVFVF